MNDILTYIAEDIDKGKRIDVFIAENNDTLTRSRVKNLIGNAKITLNGEPVKKSGVVLKDGDVVKVEIEEPVALNLEPQDIQLDIVYEDDYLAVINKPQGMVVHPAPGSYDGTLVNALLFQLTSLSSINGVIRPGIVHRLDKNTSGLIVVAKTDEAHISLQKQIASKEAKRYYVALVDGRMKKKRGEVNEPIERSKKDRKKMAISPTGRNALTLYHVLEVFDKPYSLVEYELKTGRTHQIRVHSKFLGYPIVGDDVYGGSNKFDLKGQLLHAFKLTFTHPITGEYMEFRAPIPDYFERVLTYLGGKFDYEN